MTVTGDAQAGLDTGSGSGKAEPWAGSLERVDLGEIPYNEATEAMRGWVAAVANYVTARFGAAPSAITPAEITRLRRE